MFKYFHYIKINRLRIFLLVVLLIVTQSGFSQCLKWIDGYQLKLNTGGRIEKYKSYPILGVMGGLAIQHPQKRLGLNIRTNYMIPKLYKVNLPNFDDRSYIIYYFELTYKFLYIKQKPFMIGLGLERPSYTIDPFHDCPYCFMNFLTISLQRQIWKTNFEIRYSEGIGNKYFGWYYINCHYFSLGINHAFELKRKSKKLH